MSAVMASPEHEEQSEGLTYDECFDLLSNYRRRYALHYLEQNGEHATISDLAEQVAAWEYDISPADVSYDERKRVYTSLQQVHLPRMDRMDVVEFDSDQGTVEIGPAAGELDIYLDVVTGRDISWSGLYVGVALLNAGLFLGGVLGVPLLGAIPPGGWAVFAVTAFLVLSLAHTYLARTEMRLDVGEPPQNE